jgi:DNA-binding protein YbaB
MFVACMRCMSVIKIRIDGRFIPSMPDVIDNEDRNTITMMIYKTCETALADLDEDMSKSRDALVTQSSGPGDE